MENLAYRIKNDKLFSIQTCLSIRARGSVHREKECAESLLMNVLAGEMRFEIIVPDISFEAVRINTIPILATPLSKKLTDGACSNSFNIFCRPKMGFLTLNQTRKVVTILENDPSAGIVPLVGIWVALPNIAGFDATDGLEELLKHPFCWGACVRYLYGSMIKDRVFIEKNTFLLVRQSVSTYNTRIIHV